MLAARTKENEMNTETIESTAAAAAATATAASYATLMAALDAVHCGQISQAEWMAVLEAVAS